MTRRRNHRKPSVPEDATLRPVVEIQRFGATTDEDSPMDGPTATETEPPEWMKQTLARQGLFTYEQIDQMTAPHFFRIWKAYRKMQKAKNNCVNGKASQPRRSKE
jgi:hypothetical protein